MNSIDYTYNFDDGIIVSEVTEEILIEIGFQKDEYNTKLQEKRRLIGSINRIISDNFNYTVKKGYIIELIKSYYSQKYLNGNDCDTKENSVSKMFAIIKAKIEIGDTVKRDGKYSIVSGFGVDGMLIISPVNSGNRKKIIPTLVSVVKKGATTIIKETQEKCDNKIESEPSVKDLKNYLKQNQIIKEEDLIALFLVRSNYTGSFNNAKELIDGIKAFCLSSESIKKELQLNKSTQDMILLERLTPLLFNQKIKEIYGSILNKYYNDFKEITIEKIKKIKKDSDQFKSLTICFKILKRLGFKSLLVPQKMNIVDFGKMIDFWKTQIDKNN